MKYDWKKIRNYYIHHNVTLEETAKKFKVSIRTLQTHSSKEKWIDAREKKREEIASKSEEIITKKEIDKKVKANELHTELYDKGLAVANLILDNYLASLLSGQKRKGATATNLDYLMSAIQKCQKGQRMSLNIEAEDTGATEPEVMIINGLDIDRI